MTESGLEMWTIYDHPRDYPNHFVARLFVGEKATAKVLVTDSLEALRAVLSIRGLVRLERNYGDDPVILETWL